MDPKRNRDLTLPAGRVLGIVLIALVVASLLNSQAIVRAGEGMEEGTTRSIVLSVGRPPAASHPWSSVPSSPQNWK